MIVCIPSRKRPDTKTWKLFADAGYEVYHFLEPQDFNEYDVPNKINIGENNKGLMFVRNFKLDWLKKNGHKWAWFADDDIMSFGIYNGKTVKKDASILKSIEDAAAKLPFEIIGMNYCQHAWHEKKAWSVNRKFPDVCALLNVEKIKWRFKEKFPLKGDRDFALQCIKYGSGILRFNHIWFNCPNVGSNEGGLHEKYVKKEDEEAARMIVKEWHPFITLKMNKGRIDMKADIKAVAAHYKKEIV